MRDFSLSCQFIREKECIRFTSILTGDLSSDKIMANSNVGGMGKTKGSSSNTMRSSISVGSIDTSIKKLSISITLSVVSNTIDTGITSIAGDGNIEGIDTGSTLQADTTINHLRICKGSSHNSRENYESIHICRD